MDTQQEAAPAQQQQQQQHASAVVILREASQALRARMERAQEAAVAILGPAHAQAGRAATAQQANMLSHTERLLAAAEKALSSSTIPAAAHQQVEQRQGHAVAGGNGAVAAAQQLPAGPGQAGVAADVAVPAPVGTAAASAAQLRAQLHAMRLLSAGMTLGEELLERVGGLPPAEAVQAVAVSACGAVACMQKARRTCGVVVPGEGGGGGFNRTLARMRWRWGRLHGHVLEHIVCVDHRSHAPACVGQRAKRGALAGPCVRCGVGGGGCAWHAGR